ncbi:hypothetical protein HanRHA438_Chr13g0611971 [Helianthus annuus]|uniref:Uncharacterized protein n=1 Tax=Helianthus annuus TaxID=4232 RepID=A0A9K3EM90_HELAN|nr:hypothetical protein HanXRQr2_Chr13g0601521 [Helianthus annuus]KAJ0477873.1 hypothetical protein HanHA300_Chr13g0493571 [Helianthus annuus]KAJ0482470.1 hypothetical protein HanIR_Chr13g0654271 [Helianthus annuus]KAJ0498701.1 hypothetical protein HanHA89_Chr13g0525661 [Helianthus annuus]KAJ0664715.1 hypothetical protein HanLR1_Chr13g0495661 [Helianthus annuus]
MRLLSDPFVLSLPEQATDQTTTATTDALPYLLVINTDWHRRRYRSSSIC